MAHLPNWGWTLQSVWNPTPRHKVHLPALPNYIYWIVVQFFHRRSHDFQCESLLFAQLTCCLHVAAGVADGFPDVDGCRTQVRLGIQSP